MSLGSVFVWLTVINLISHTLGVGGALFIHVSLAQKLNREYINLFLIIFQIILDSLAYGF